MAELRGAAKRYAQAKFHFLEAFCGTREREAWHVIPKPYNTFAGELSGDNLFGLSAFGNSDCGVSCCDGHTVVLHGNHIDNS